MYPCNHETCPVLEIELVPLTKGKYAIVDKDDYEWLSNYPWCAEKMTGNRFRAKKRLGQRETDQPYNIRMHRYILGLRRYDKEHVDHINHNQLDNRRCNIRLCTQKENNRNTRKKRGSISIYKGVRWHPTTKKWRPSIKVDGKQIYFGLYEKEEDAAKAYNEMAKK